MKHNSGYSRKIFSLFLIIIFSVTATVFAGPGVFDVTTFGAKGDGKTVNTDAFRKAMDACRQRGGGTVNVPPGVFVTGTIFFADHTELHLEPGAVIKASSNRDDYCKLDAYPQNFESFNECWSGGHLLVAVNVQDVSLTGPGLIDGTADVFLGKPEKLSWASTAWRHGFARNKIQYKGTDPEMIRRELRPGQLIVFCESRDIRVSNISIRNSPCWCCFLHGCEDVFISGVKIDNPPYYANSDGIDIDCCRNVVVSDCRILTGDDAFALRGNPRTLTDKTRVCENVVITNCVCSSASSVFRIGVGEGVIRDINVSNIIILEGGTGIHLQSSFSARAPLGVSISRIHFSNISMRNVAFPFVITPGTPTATAQIEDILFEGIRAESFLSAKILKNAHTSPRRITVRNSEFITIPSPVEFKSYPEVYFDIDGARDSIFENVTLRWNETKHWKKAMSDVKSELLDYNYKIYFL